MICGFDNAMGASVHVRTYTLHLFFRLFHFHLFTLYLGNGWTDCADIWHVGSDQLVMWLQHAHRVSLCM